MTSCNNMEEIGESYLGIRSGRSLSFSVFSDRLIVRWDPMGEPLNNLRIIYSRSLGCTALSADGQSLPDVMFYGRSFGLGSDSVNGCRGGSNEFSLSGRCPKTPSQWHSRRVSFVPYSIWSTFFLDLSRWILIDLKKLFLEVGVAEADLVKRNIQLCRPWKSYGRLTL